MQKDDAIISEVCCS